MKKLLLISVFSLATFFAKALKKDEIVVRVNDSTFEIQPSVRNVQARIIAPPELRGPEHDNVVREAISHPDSDIFLRYRVSREVVKSFPFFLFRTIHTPVLLSYEPTDILSFDTHNGEDEIVPEAGLTMFLGHSLTIILGVFLCWFHFVPKGPKETASHSVRLFFFLCDILVSIVVYVFMLTSMSIVTVVVVGIMSHREYLELFITTFLWGGVGYVFELLWLKSKKKLHVV